MLATTAAEIYILNNVSISAIIGNSKANAGRKLILGEIKNEFEKLKADL
ncbi:hypothetical protein [Pseudomonas umsongensis]|uniref:Uncharacterized protein n=1 Tax=Pseudomonas umsongensis TaxID=198618 RepID=A0AAE6ZYD0_9PSED|nr:hypothetical protein [Pseudomonas umsongensis]QJC81100.1 hypothetical protein HGP31_23325 [Pseudomonas umsongensis]